MVSKSHSENPTVGVIGPTSWVHGTAPPEDGIGYNQHAFEGCWGNLATRIL
jgi:hypothetical protein